MLIFQLAGWALQRNGQLCFGFMFVHLHCVYGLKLSVFLSCNEFYTYVQNLIFLWMIVFLFNSFFMCLDLFGKMLHWEKIPFFYHAECLISADFSGNNDKHHQIAEIVMERHIIVDRKEFPLRSKHKVHNLEEEIETISNLGGSLIKRKLL